MTLQEAYISQNNNKKEIVVRVPELVHLVKHLDLLYSELISKKQEPEYNHGQPMVEILGKPYIQTAGWYNAGQGIKQSAVVQ